LGESPHSSVSDYLTMIIEPADPMIATAFIRGLAAEWPDESAPELSEDVINRLSGLSGVLPDEAQEHLTSLAETWDYPGLFGTQ
ncbi:MAG: hypothetical protein RI573_14505, partial [Balneolaceae bacterium]|nr:hypothetical protein [Balneolaceae bacterium]